jgi:hypothetical protein
LPKRRCAVVIGVNRTGDLPLLQGSAAGADEVADWLSGEGFEARKFTDSGGAVTPRMIADAIESFVNAGNCYQLVVYFSGHGYWKNENELWLLTDAPKDANAAVSWMETAEFAKDCGIPNVVLISDACRAIPTSATAMRVRGSIVFPNRDVQGVRAKVDKFMAAATGTAAYELKLTPAGNRESIFTHCFLNAFEHPEPEMIREIDEDGKQVKVVPTRRLERYLQERVPALLAEYNLQMNQQPDIEILSNDEAYIGRAGSPEVPKRAQLTAAARVTLHDVASSAIGTALGKEILRTKKESVAIGRLARNSGFNSTLRLATTLADTKTIDIDTGFAVIGSGVVAAASSRDAHVDILDEGSNRSVGVVQVSTDGPATSIAFIFSNRLGTVLPVLHGYIGHVNVEDGGISHVSYVPSGKSNRWIDYERHRERLDGLRAAVTAAVHHGVFRLDDNLGAASLAKQIKAGKALDPALGIYAAYAYSEANQRERVRSIQRYMHADLDTDLFDVAMLSRRIGEQPISLSGVVPFCPVLTQGWNLLRSRGIVLPKILDDAQDELASSLWTAFKPRRAELILGTISRGMLP